MIFLKRSILFGLAVFLFGVGCSSPPVKTVIPDRKLLFPYGTYKHSITLHLQDNRRFHFKGIVDLRENSLQLVGLSFFNTTVFRLKEDRVTKKLDVEIFQEQLKKYEDKVRQFYGNLRNLLVLDAHPHSGKGLRVVSLDDDEFPKQLRFNVAEKDVDVTFKAYDAKKVPERVEIKRPEFSVDLIVTGYEI